MWRSKDVQQNFYKVKQCPRGMFRMDGATREHDDQPTSTTSHSVDRAPTNSSAGAPQQRLPGVVNAAKRGSLGGSGVASHSKKMMIQEGSKKICGSGQRDAKKKQMDMPVASDDSDSYSSEDDDCPPRRKGDDDEVMRCSAGWNALLQNESGEVVARTKIRSLKQIPSIFEVYWNGEQQSYQEDFDPVLRHANDMRPLFIKMKMIPEATKKEKKNVEIVKKYELRGRSAPPPPPLPPKKLSCKEVEVKRWLDIVSTSGETETETKKTKGHGNTRGVRDYMIYSGDVAGGFAEGFGAGPLKVSGFSFVDLERGVATGEGNADVRKDDEWHAYSTGLNLIGKCSNMACVYNKKNRIYDVMIRKGFNSTVKLEASIRLFLECPGCKAQPPSFTPTNFLVCEARASFRYKTVHNTFEAVVVESPHPFPKFTAFKEGGRRSRYKLIEAFACKTYESLFSCLLCGDPIGHRDEEVRGGSCNHYFHTRCLNRRRETSSGCPTCNVPFQYV